MEKGLVKSNTLGMPQGGPLSPILSNIYLDKFDKELEARGLHFVRYADDCNIFVKSEMADEVRHIMAGKKAVPESQCHQNKGGEAFG